MFATLMVSPSVSWSEFDFMVRPGYHSMPALFSNQKSLFFMFGDRIERNSDAIIVEAYFPENAFNTSDDMRYIAEGDDFVLTDGIRYRGTGKVLSLNDAEWDERKFSRMGENARGETKIWSQDKDFLEFKAGIIRHLGQHGFELEMNESPNKNYPDGAYFATGISFQKEGLSGLVCANDNGGIDISFHNADTDDSFEERMYDLKAIQQKIDSFFNLTSL